MMIFINGVKQIAGIDYVSSNNCIQFSSPPAAMDTIEIQGRNGVLARILGDGYSYRFDFMNDIDHDTTYMLEDAFKLRNVPAVAEALERLQVVVALTKQNDSIR
jgi:hypothetical protein